MPLESNSKKLILLKTKKAIADLQKSSFTQMGRLVNRLISVAEIFPDEVWSQELKFSAFIIAGIGTSAETQVEENDKEKKDRIINLCLDFLNSFYKAVEEENAQKIDDLLKWHAIVFIDEIAL